MLSAGSMSRAPTVARRAAGRQRGSIGSDARSAETMSETTSVTAATNHAAAAVINPYFSNNIAVLLVRDAESKDPAPPFAFLLLTEQLRNFRRALGVQLDDVARPHALEELLDVAVAQADATVRFRESDRRR